MADAKIRAAIVGYGNLGKSAEKLLAQSPDMELVGVFSRRDSLDTDAPVWSTDDFAAKAEAKEFDVALLCLGSATDIPQLAPEYAKYANTVDTYDNHNDVPRHYEEMDAAAKAAGTVAIVSTGWDPGMFSLNRVYAQALLPGAEQRTFWGPGLSQGHSDAVRRVEGVKKGVQYTLPDETALDKARNRQAADLTGYSTHARQVFVVLEEGADAEAIKKEIRQMPDYFAPYENVEVNVIDEETFDAEHTGMPHGGHVITAGDTGGFNHTIEYVLKLERNPDFTAAVQIAYARAAHRLREQGQSGAFTVLEVAPYLISPTLLTELIAKNV